ncbi:MAG: cobalamin-dependent protein [Myxococcota bacterium]
MAAHTPGEPQDRARQRRELTRTIQAEIIPRLMLAHRIEVNSEVVEANHAVQAPELDVSDFVRRLLEPHLTGAQSTIGDLRRHGVAIETIFLELMAPAAHLLGARWVNDEASFTDVTVGLTHLQQLVYELAPSFGLEARRPANGHHVVLQAAPGEQHVFGLILLEEFFRREGWDVLGPASTSELDAVELVADQYVAVLGFSVSDPRAVEPLQALIKKIRAASVNPDLFIMVGGHCVLENPELVAFLGADATGRTAVEAVNTAQARLDELARTALPSSEV